jgi:hypothetical protein
MRQRSRSRRLSTLLVAVAVLALTLGGVRFPVTRPHPTGAIIEAGVLTTILWSDHESHENDWGPRICPVSVQFGLMISIVRWSDGASSYYLHRPGMTARVDCY